MEGKIYLMTAIEKSTGKTVRQEPFKKKETREKRIEALKSIYPGELEFKRSEAEW